ncbi:YdcF family protein|uniref:Uncharacterized SAM-binding protein YcdF, DUF218 family n=1 Tax=Dendrosporobacter quercicolus TaxID=146817 RepID=A0A1H0ADC9_9FIRM|nr:YdcF family protein [Dendrosporobacter quercicolus]NSL50053.1 YdcF family protein [Dendrosporobacter quercicolus DSM 1736]SDN31569.1 Uncharacterized SAM-binding protein YcdF, DUF218 family [Dendrosporobacter quercicolus]
MIELLQFFYSTFLLPPGIFIILLVLCCLQAYRYCGRLPKLLTVITLTLYLCSTQWVSDMIIRPLESQYTPPLQPQGDVIVLLGGGALPDIEGVHGLGQLSGFAANRLLTAAHLYQRLRVPILVSGGQVYQTSGWEAEIAKSILIGLGVPQNEIIVENQSRNTTENARYSKELLDQNGFCRPLLVTSAFHMARAVRQFEKAGLSVLPFPADYQANVVPVFTFSQLRPTAGSLQTVSLAAKEYIGLGVSKWY